MRRERKLIARCGKRSKKDEETGDGGDDGVDGERGESPPHWFARD